MNDSYVELLVKQKETIATKIKRVLVIVGIVISVIFTLISKPLFAIVGLALVFGLSYYSKNISSIEYEYTYCNGEIDIDRISGQQSRKRVMSFNAEEMEVLAPSDSSQLQPYQNLKVYDFSSNSENNTYEVVTKFKDKDVRVKFEPNEEILEGMRFRAPRKVFL